MSKRWAKASRLQPERWPGDGDLIVAFSGGPDSSCLLHMLAHMPLPRPLRAIHIDHGLDPDSADRAKRAIEMAARWGVEGQIIQVAVTDTGIGPEAAARQARYQALAANMSAGDRVLTGHHLADQAETLLLRLIRGASAEALGGMAPYRRLGPGWLCRPLLQWHPAEIVAYLKHHAIVPLHDPANLDPRLDRNFLNAEIMPRLEARWPSCTAVMTRSAHWCRLAGQALQAQAKDDFESLSRLAGPRQEQVMDCPGWLGLGPGRAGELLRHWCRRLEIPPPPLRRFTAFFSQCRTARADRNPQLDWTAGLLCRHGGFIWLIVRPEPPPSWSVWWDRTEALELPAGLGRLRIRGAGHALAAEPAWQVGGGIPGEVLKPAGRGHTQRVSELMRKAGLPGWHRRHWPRIHSRGKLLAVADVWLDHSLQETLARDGAQLVWEAATISALAATGNRVA